MPAIRLILPDGTLEHAVGPLFVQGNVAKISDGIQINAGGVDFLRADVAKY